MERGEMVGPVSMGLYMIDTTTPTPTHPYTHAYLRRRLLPHKTPNVRPAEGQPAQPQRQLCLDLRGHPAVGIPSGVRVAYFVRFGSFGLLVWIDCLIQPKAYQTNLHIHKPHHAHTQASHPSSGSTPRPACPCTPSARSRQTGGRRGRRGPGLCGGRNRRRPAGIVRGRGCGSRRPSGRRAPGFGFGVLVGFGLGVCC